MDLENTIIANRYILDSKLGNGSFGVVYLAHSMQTNEKVAVKIEPTSTHFPQLISEARIMRLLGEAPGFPKVYWHGTENDRNILVMELLGPSLADLHDKLEKFSLKTVVMLAYQMIERVEHMHERDVINRDIKPDNFLMGTGHKSKILYMVDFGLSKKFREPKMKMHIRYREGKSLTGTARYASINTHIGIEQSRRDDVETIGYVLIFLLKGTLPWQNINCHTKQEKYHKIMELKMSTSVEKLCEKLPPEFAGYLNYCKSLHFEAAPDYSYLKYLFTSVASHYDFVFDDVFDWSEHKKHKSIRKSRKRKGRKSTKREKAKSDSEQYLETLEDRKLPEFKDREAIMKIYNGKETHLKHASCMVF